MTEPTVAPDEVIAFDMYFASLMSMQVHPGAGTKAHRKLTLHECRDMAMSMLELRRTVVTRSGGN